MCLWRVRSSINHLPNRAIQAPTEGDRAVDYVPAAAQRARISLRVSAYPWQLLGIGPC
jgi:hypothetical protein